MPTTVWSITACRRSRPQWRPCLGHQGLYTFKIKRRLFEIKIPMTQNISLKTLTIIWFVARHLFSSSSSMFRSFFTSCQIRALPFLLLLPFLRLFPSPGPPSPAAPGLAVSPLAPRRVASLEEGSRPEGSDTASEPRRRRSGRSGRPSPPPCARHPAISSASCSTLDASTTPHGDTSAGTVLERRACPTNAPHSSEAANHT